MKVIRLFYLMNLKKLKTREILKDIIYLRRLFVGLKQRKYLTYKHLQHLRLIINIMFHSEPGRIIIIADYPNPYWLHCGIVTDDTPDTSKTPQDGPGCEKIAK